MNSNWEGTVQEVTEAMRNHVRPFVTPLSMDRPMSNTVTLEGTGSYVMIGGKRVVVTCEHVAKRGDLNVGFYGSPGGVFGYREQWLMDPPPVDLAMAPVTDTVWSKQAHQASVIPYDRFAQRHVTSAPSELLFLFGFAGENSAYGFEHFDTAGSAYLSQEKAGGDAVYFEIFWRPKDIKYTADTTDEERAKVKHEDARGLSGSLVWNTRYIEVTNSRRTWTPADAVVTGMAQRWDDVTGTLLVYRVEHIRTWIRT